MRFLTAFQVPEIAESVIECLVTRDEVRLIEVLPSETFGVEDARIALSGAAEEPWPAERTLALLQSAYRRGVLRLEDESSGRYEVSTFYDRLEILAVGEPDVFIALPPEVRAALDRWCFETYCEGLGPEARPTTDRVLPLAEVLDLIDTVDEPIWLNRCDCRILAGHCDLPVDTCVSFRNGINTLSHRGWAKPLTRDEAKSVIRRADAAGLMHTVNEGGICNCCSDCCYLFRAQVKRGAEATWPLAESIAALDRSACIACGLCVERCPFGALTLEGDEVVQHLDLCRGCGLCAETCPTSALTMIPIDGTRSITE